MDVMISLCRDQQPSLLGKYEAFRIAANIAKPPELVRKTQNNEAANLGGFRVTG
jgi:hypothetical protein